MPVVGKKADEYKFDVFICHASEDKESIVRPIRKECEKRGMAVFLDEEELGWGDNLVEGLNNALHTSKRVLVVWSSNAAKKQWPKKELTTAMAREVTSGQKQVLLLAVSEQALDGWDMLKDKVYKTWDGNASEIADALHKDLFGTFWNPTASDD